MVEERGAGARAEQWRTREVDLLLDCIAEQPGTAMRLMQSSNKRNIQYFEYVAKKLKLNESSRSASQCRSKFKKLKRSFYDSMRKFNGEPPKSRRGPHFNKFMNLWALAGRPSWNTTRDRQVGKMSKTSKPKLEAFLPTDEEASVGSESEEEPDPRTGSAETKRPKTPDSPGSVTEELIPPEDFVVVAVPTLGEEIEMDSMALHFANKKRSGPIKCCVKDGHKFIIPFRDEADAQEVLRKKDHVLKTCSLHVSKYQPETVQDQPQRSSSRVLIQSWQETSVQHILRLFLRNVSDLSEDYEDFNVEMLPNRNAAVISFDKPVEIDHFVQAFNKYHMAKDLRTSAHILEATDTILIANIPPGISREHILTYFESKKCGGGPVLNYMDFPDENSALVTFQNAKDATTVLRWRHSLNGVPVLLYPYYVSLNTALYGKDQPQMPGVSRVALDAYHWKFLQQNEHLRQEIERKMAGCYCAIEWPARDCSFPEITVRPLPALLEQNRSSIKSWNGDVSTRLASILSQHKVVRCKAEAAAWEAIRDSVKKTPDILVLPESPQGVMVLMGAAEAVERALGTVTVSPKPY